MMTRKAGLCLTPPNPQRNFVSASIMRAAMELGHPQDYRYGVDPKRTEHWILKVIFTQTNIDPPAVPFTFKRLQADFPLPLRIPGACQCAVCDETRSHENYTEDFFQEGKFPLHLQNQPRPSANAASIPYT